MNAIIVEDDMSIQVVIKTLIDRHANHVNIIDTHRSVSAAVESIVRHSPDVVFLDIEIIGGSGFDILAQTKNIPYHVIFITGHSKYAIEALRADAIDYVMKPIIKDEFINAIERLNQKEKNNPNTTEKQTLIIYGSLRDTKVSYDDIIYAIIEKGRTCFHLSNNRYIRSPLPFSNYNIEDKMVQIHRNYFINIAYISEIESGRGGYLFMEDGTKLPIAYRRKNQLLKEWTSYHSSKKS